MTELPTLKEELERKAYEMLVRLDTQIKAGTIDPRGAWVTASTIWTLTAGLVDNDTSQAAADMANENHSPGWRRSFAHSTKAPLSLRVLAGKGYALLKVDTNTGETTTVKAARLDPGDLEIEIDRIVAGLKAAGYIEL